EFRNNLTAFSWKRFARVQLLRGYWILRVHVHHQVGIGGKERHLAFSIATISAVCVGLDELPDSEAVRGFVGRDGSVFAHELVSLFDLSRHGKSGHSRM